ncbi:MAG: flavin reductase family protein [Dongiaceae bacterium]
MIGVEDFLAMMRRAATGVTVVTTDGPAGRAGVTVSAMCSVSLEPPSVLVCVRSTSGVVLLVQGNGCFCVNILAGRHKLVAECFAGRVAELREDRFACAEWHQLATGAPVLSDALASFDCKLTNEVAFGTHVILIGTVLAGRGQEGGPLIYTNRDYGVTAPLTEA